MTALDVADLVVIAGRVLGIGADAALDQADIAAAHAALAEARSAGHEAGAQFADRAVAVAAGVGLMHALLRHRPFPQDGGQLAVAAALQFLALNGWRADLEPPEAAAVAIEALAAGRLSQESAEAWLSSRTSSLPSPRARQARFLVPARSLEKLRSAQLRGKPAVSRKAISVVVAISAGGLSLLATACSQGPQAHVARTGGQPSVTRMHAGNAAR